MAEPFEGWAILELMGHRRLAGRVSEIEIAGAKMLRLDVPGVGTGRCRWPCSRPATHGGDLSPGARCFEHAAGAPETVPLAATQFYSAQAIYCLTPTTEDIARRLAAQSQPAPVARWELPPAAPATRQDAEAADLDDDGPGDREPY
jgi:hypothetical protein